MSLSRKDYPNRLLRKSLFDHRTKQEERVGDAKVVNPMTSIEQLKNLMSGISERCWYAGWLMHTEFVLWKAVQEGPMQWGHGIITAEDIARLKQLADITSGWIVWNDTDGEVFIPMEQWLSIYSSMEP